MIDSIEILAFIVATSICVLGLFCLYTSFQISRFIVKRYEKETDLLNTVFFKEHATFTRYLPDFFSSAFYGCHLLMCVWGWWLYGKRKMFRDIKDPAFVVQHFSRKEVRLIKRYAVIGIILFFHGVAFYIFRAIWPEVFS